jgi:hypothetical protein
MTGVQIRIQSSKRESRKMAEREEFGNFRKVLGIFDMFIGSALGGMWVFFFLWVLVIFPAAIIYWAWPWLAGAWEWLRALLTVV